MISPKEFYDTLCQNGVDFFCGVPDSLLKDFCAYITDNAPQQHHLITANEGTATALAAGHYLASKKPAVVYMQNSGIGNAINPLLSLCDEKVYSIPVILVIGWRGEPGVHDEPQHAKQGAVTLPLLESMAIPYSVISPSDDAQQIKKVIEQTVCNSTLHLRPHALVIKKGAFEKYTLQNSQHNDLPICREEALSRIIDIMHDDDIVVSTTGKLSRELFELRRDRGEGHQRDFLTVGSMGHASTIALGIALEKPNRRVFCLDGDGAFIMHMGALTNIAAEKPQNFIHVVFNNGAHESVGAQPTLAMQFDITQVAKAVGYKNAISISKAEDFASLEKIISHCDGPLLIELKVAIKSRSDLGRPTTSPQQNKEAFMQNLMQK